MEAQLIERNGHIDEDLMLAAQLHKGIVLTDGEAALLAEGLNAMLHEGELAAARNALLVIEGLAQHGLNTLYKDSIFNQIVVAAREARGGA